MGTFSTAYIKNTKTDQIKSYLGQHFEILSEEVVNQEQSWKFWENGNDTMILSNVYNYRWTQLYLNLDISLYKYDELLRRISKEFNTEILFCYYQTTICKGRLAKFDEGQLILSIVQEEVEIKGERQLRLTDNWGVDSAIRSQFNIPKLMEKFINIDYDNIYKFLNINNLEWDKIDKDEEYNHIEIKIK